MGLAIVISETCVAKKGEEATPSVSQVFSNPAIRLSPKAEGICDIPFLEVEAGFLRDV